MTGHIEKKKGKFQVVLEYGIDEKGKRIRKYKTFDKESDAKKYLIQMLANEGKFILLNDFLDQWLEEYAKNYVAPKTYLRYRDALKHIKDAFQNHTLNQINAFELQKFFNKLSSQYSFATVKKIFSVCNNAFKTAIKWNMLKENPLEFVKLPNKFEEKKIKVWDIETVKRFLEDIRDEKIHTAVTLALHAGLRAGEICGLTWDNVDFENKRIFVKQALQKIGKEIIIKPPKSQTSIRTIYMTSYLYETLLEEYRRQEPLREAYKKLGNFVCIHETGQPFCPDYLTHTFKKLVRRLGYPEIRFHDLRHTFATILLQAQTDPKTAAELLGHSDTKLFLNLYAHVLDEQKIKATQKIEEILG